MIPLAAAGYCRDLGDGLLARWSTREDRELIANLMGLVWRQREDDPPSERAMDAIRERMRPGWPLMGPGDYALVQATLAPGAPVVASVGLWRQEWAYEGIPFTIGRAESVATHPDYRHRGLIRTLFEMIHARSEAEGHLVQAITGIPNFYRQFGYGYGVDLRGRRVVYVSHIPAAREGEPEYTLRPAVAEDIPLIADLYRQSCAGSIVHTIVPERYWRYQIEAWSEPALRGRDIRFIERGDCIQMIVSPEGNACGFVMVTPRRRRPEIEVFAMEVTRQVNLPIAIGPILRALAAYGQSLPVSVPNAGAFTEISLQLGGRHPIYDAMAPLVAPRIEPPYAWYVRVPDLPAFLRYIGPALEQRLAASPAALYTGELCINLYRGGFRLAFTGGRLTAVEPWRPPAYGPRGDAGFPPLVFLQLLFGRRSLADLSYAFPDVWATPQAEPLLNALFPARPSWVMPL